MRLSTLLFTMLLALPVFAGVEIYNGTTKLGTVDRIICSTGTNCLKTFNDRATLTVSGSPSVTTLTVSGSATFNGGIGQLVGGTGPMTTFPTWPTPTLTSGTSTAPVATTLYLSQVFIPINATLTGVAVNNAGTCGTNKYVVGIWDSFGNLLKQSAVAGTLCSGTSAWQQVPFTAVVNVKGPQVYWIGLMMNGTTDRFYTIPAVGQFAGLSGTITSVGFGTMGPIQPPTTFTAGAGPVAFTY
jgi:hypothetical protein